MTHGQPSHEQSLATLSTTVANAAAFFKKVDEACSDGYQTARQVLSHLVFWHRDYVATVRALAQARPPAPRTGRFADWNAAASEEFKRIPLPQLAEYLVRLQSELGLALRDLPDWSLHFPIKEGGTFCSVERRVPMIEAHIRNHVARLRRTCHPARVSRHSNLETS